MMQAQGELVASIDNNVEDTVAPIPRFRSFVMLSSCPQVVNVTAAQDMWVNYLERISSNR